MPYQQQQYKLTETIGKHKSSNCKCCSISSKCSNSNSNSFGINNISDDSLTSILVFLSPKVIYFRKGLSIFNKLRERSKKIHTVSKILTTTKIFGTQSYPILMQLIIWLHHINIIITWVLDCFQRWMNCTNSRTM